MELARHTAELLSGDLPPLPKRWKPSIWTVEHQGKRLLVKDVRYANRLFRYTLGRWTLRREERAYRRLCDLPCMARFAYRLDADAIVLERMDAVPLSKRIAKRLDMGYFDELSSVVDEMHDRGVVHLDLRHRSNLLVGTDGRPRIVDFENAVYLGTSALSRRVLVPMVAWVDRSAVLKFRVRYLPEQVSEAEARRDRFFRRWRKLWPFGRVWPLRSHGE